MELGNSNLENTEQKQTVKLTSVLSLIAFSGAMVLMFGPAWRGTADMDREKSIVKAQSLAYQVVAIEAKKHLIQVNNAMNASPQALKSRSPASLEASTPSSIGKDPWGQPYFYKIRHEGSQTFVDVWSEGPNGIKTQVLIPTGYL